MTLCYKNTFIDVMEPDDGLNRPRVFSRAYNSDPGSVFSRAATRSDSLFFQPETDYITDLCARLTKQGLTISLTKNGDDDDGTSTDSESRFAKPRHGNYDAFSETTRASSKSDDATPMDVATFKMSTSKRSQVVQTIRVKTAEAQEEFAQQRLSNALSSISEIPERVDQLFQQRTNDVKNQVHGNVADMQDILLNNSTSIECIKVIPGLVQGNFNASFARAMRDVRMHVDVVVQGLEAEGCGDSHNACVLQQIQSIPAEVRQITANAVERAAEISQEQVAMQVGYARNAATRPFGMTNALDHAQLTMVEVPSELANDAAMAAETNVEQALDAVQSSTKVDKTIANKVADALMRAKGTMAIQDSLSLHNPGSIGHPELCARPCMFFAQGKCSNGLACAFCHVSHPTRVASLDKRNREALEKLNVAERFLLVAPILRNTLERMRSCENYLHELDDVCARLRMESQYNGKGTTKKTRQLTIGLKSLSAGQLLSLLQKNINGYPHIERFLQRCFSNSRGCEVSNYEDIEVS